MLDTQLLASHEKLARCFALRDLAGFADELALILNNHQPTTLDYPTAVPSELARCRHEQCMAADEFATGRIARFTTGEMSIYLGVTDMVYLKIMVYCAGRQLRLLPRGHVAEVIELVLSALERAKLQEGALNP